MLGFGFIVVDCKGAVCSEGIGGDFRGVEWWSSEGFLDFCLDNCREGIYLTRLRLASFAGFGVVVLFATFATRLAEGRAVSSSCFTIAALVSWSCAVSTCGGIWSRVRLGIRFRSEVPSCGLDDAYCGCLAKLPALMCVAVLDQVVNALDVVE